MSAWGHGPIPVSRSSDAAHGTCLAGDRPELLLMVETSRVQLRALWAWLAGMVRVARKGEAAMMCILSSFSWRGSFRWRLACWVGTASLWLAVTAPTGRADVAGCPGAPEAGPQARGVVGG